MATWEDRLKSYTRPQEDESQYVPDGKPLDIGVIGANPTEQPDTWEDKLKNYKPSPAREQRPTPTIDRGQQSLDSIRAEQERESWLPPRQRTAGEGIVSGNRFTDAIGNTITGQNESALGRGFASGLNNFMWQVSGQAPILQDDPEGWFDAESIGGLFGDALGAATYLVPGIGQAGKVLPRLTVGVGEKIGEGVLKKLGTGAVVGGTVGLGQGALDTGLKLHRDEVSTVKEALYNTGQKAFWKAAEGALDVGLLDVGAKALKPIFGKANKVSRYIDDLFFDPHAKGVRKIAQLKVAKTQNDLLLLSEQQALGVRGGDPTRWYGGRGPEEVVRGQRPPLNKAVQETNKILLGLSDRTAQEAGQTTKLMIQAGREEAATKFVTMDAAYENAVRLGIDPDKAALETGKAFQVQSAVPPEFLPASNRWYYRNPPAANPAESAVITRNVSTLEKGLTTNPPTTKTPRGQSATVLATKGKRRAKVFPSAKVSSLAPEERVFPTVTDEIIDLTESADLQVIDNIYTLFAKAGKTSDISGKGLNAAQDRVAQKILTNQEPDTPPEIEGLGKWGSTKEVAGEYQRSVAVAHEIKKDQLSFWERLQNAAVDPGHILRKRLEAYGGTKPDADVAGYDAVTSWIFAKNASSKANHWISEVAEQWFDGIDDEAMPKIVEYINHRGQADMLDRKIEQAIADEIGYVPKRKFLPESLNARADEILAQNPQYAELIERKAREFFAANRKLLDYLHENKGIRTEVYDAIKDNNYVMSRFLNHSARITSPDGYTLPKEAISKLKHGSDAPLDPDIWAGYKQTVSKFINRVERNKANRSLAKFIDEHPDNRIAVHNEPAMVNGKPEYYQPSEGREINWVRMGYQDDQGTFKEVLMHPEFAEAWTNGDAIQSAMLRHAIDIMSWASGAKTLKATTTGYNPLWAPKNFVLDIGHQWSHPQRAGFFPKYLKELSEDLYHTFGDAWNEKGRWHDAWIRESGPLDQGITAETQIFDKMMGVRKGVYDSVPAKTKKATGWFLGKLTIPQNFGERWMRYALERHLVVRKEFSERNAIREALDIANYSEGGWIPRFLDVFHPYTRAAVNISRAQVRNMQANKPLFFFKQSQVLIGAATASYMAWSAYPHIMEKISVWDKGRKVMIPLGDNIYKIDADGSKRYGYVRLPMDSIYAITTHIGNELGRWMATGEKPDIGGIQDTMYSTFPVALGSPFLDSKTILATQDQGGIDPFWGRPVSSNKGKGFPKDDVTEQTHQFFIDLIGALNDLVLMGGDSPKEQQNTYSPQITQAVAGKFINPKNPIPKMGGWLYDQILTSQKDTVPGTLAYRRMINQKIYGGADQVLVRDFFGWTGASNTNDFDKVSEANDIAETEQRYKDALAERWAAEIKTKAKSWEEVMDATDLMGYDKRETKEFLKKIDAYIARPDLEYSQDIRPLMGYKDTEQRAKAFAQKGLEINNRYGRLAFNNFVDDMYAYQGIFSQTGAGKFDQMFWEEADKLGLKYE